MPGQDRLELSEREYEILRLVATGASNKQIAQALVISANTVKVHLRNIFAKIGVTSRTEATLYAIREGLVQVTGEVSATVDGMSTGRLGESAGASHERRGRRYRTVSGWLVALLLLASMAIIVSIVRRPASLSPATATQQIAAPIRWQAQASLPTARSGLAVATYENRIFAIGGDGLQGATGRVEIYDVHSDSWTVGTPKPLAVADVSAAVIGGQIYVPGGRLATGEVTRTLEVYDPHEDRWQQRTPLPKALSAFAMVAFEGRLYVFGGWDGHDYQATVYEYDPNRDQWIERMPLPSARGFSGAAVAGGKIYVIGGTDGKRALTANEEYLPENEARGLNPWRQGTDMPDGRYGMGITSVADFIYIVGGNGSPQPLFFLEYIPQQDAWQQFDVADVQPWSNLGLVVVETHLHALGGRLDQAPITQHLSYQALYTIAIPVIK